MKTNLTGLILLFALLFFGCNKKEEVKENESSEDNGQEVSAFFTDLILNQEDEKIALLSIIKNTQKDTVKLILKEYLSEADNVFKSQENKTDYLKIIDLISNKFNMNKNKVSSIIFSYKYEMLTQEDVVNEYKENSNFENDETDY